MQKHPWQMPFCVVYYSMTRENWLNVLRQRDKDRDRMKEMAEMNKAFDDFDKACVAATKACQDFIDMDINKTTKPTLEERASSPADDARKNPTQRDEVASQTFYYW